MTVKRDSLSDHFDSPLSEDECAEIAAMPSHELYLLTKMVPPATVRGREINALYLACLDRMVAREALNGGEANA